MSTQRGRAGQRMGIPRNQTLARLAALKQVGPAAEQPGRPRLQRATGTIDIDGRVMGTTPPGAAAARPADSWTRA